MNAGQTESVTESSSLGFGGRVGRGRDTRMHLQLVPSQQKGLKLRG
jgi:hypothetical protein